VTEEATEESTQGITQESATAESQTQDSQTEEVTPVGATLNPSHVGATAPGFQTEGDCGPFTGEFDWAFHFVFQGSSTDFTSIVASFTGGTVVHSTFEGKHAFVYVNSDNGPITLDSASATTVHNGGNQELDTTFNLSHICEGEGGAEETTLTVIKTVNTNNNPEFTGVASDFSINVTTDGGAAVFGPFMGSETGTVVDITSPGQTFRVTEADTRGYNLMFSGDCTATGDGISADVFVAAGEHKTCTLTNTAPPVTETEGTLNVIKVVDTNNNPEFTGSPGDFMISVQTDGGTPVEGPFAGESDPGTAVTVPGGQTFQVIEPDTRGYNLTFGGDCAADGTVFVDVGQTKTCTLTNTAPDVEDNASIIVRKEAGDDEATLFPFTFGLMGGAATSFDLEDDAADTNVDDMRTFGSLGAGVFVIADVGVDGWSLTDITCTSDGTLSVVEDMDAGTATVTLAAGENVECIFTNAENPVAGTSQVTIVKDAGGLPNSAVSFTVEGFDGLTGFDLDDDPATATPNIQVIPGISDDTFTVTEGLVAGWELADIVCVNDADEEDDLEGIATASLGDREVVFDIGANLGLSITCTFFNEQAQVGETPTVTPTTPATETPTVSPTTETPTVSPTTETPTASPTTETPTASPTTPATATEETTVESLAPSTSTTGGVIQESAVGGATPIAPSTGTGTNAAEQTATLGLIIAGLVAMTAGASLLAIRRRS
jgi:hypothetical protein